MRGGAGLGTQDQGNRRDRKTNTKTSPLMNTDRTDQKQIETNQRGAVKLGNTKKFPFGTGSREMQPGATKLFPRETPVPTGAADSSPLRSRVPRSGMRDKGWVGLSTSHIHTAVGWSVAAGGATVKKRA